MLALLEAIKTIIYNSEDQKYLPLSLHNAKKYYNFRQGTMTNPDYLEKFMNLTEMAESYEGTLHVAAVFKIALLTSNLRNMPEADLDEYERIIISASARKIYLSCAFVIASNPKRYGRLVEELENDYTEGNNKYPTNMVKSYQLINEYKSWTPRISLPEVSGVAFYQQGNPKAAQRNAEWKKKSVCHNCKKNDTLNLTAPNRSSIMMTQMRKTTRLSKTSQERKKTFKKRNLSNSPT